MLEVKNLVLSNQKQISLHISEGEFIQILGANGSGKSLFLKSMSRIIPSIFEELTFHKIHSKDLSIEEWRRRITYLPSQIFENLEQTIQDFFLYPLKFNAYKNFNPSFDPLKFIGDKNRQLKHLSTGEKQQMLILRALMLSPEVLILDETLSNLDQDKRGEMIKLIKSQGHLIKSALFVSHFSLGDEITRNYYL